MSEHPKISHEWLATGEPSTYEEWVASLPGCPGCGQVDVMDYIEGRSLCAACSLDEMSDQWEGDECAS